MHTARGRFALSALSSALFLLAYPVFVHFLPTGEIFGAFAVVPLTILSWNYGQRTGLWTAAGVVVFTLAIFLPEYFLVRRSGVSFYPIMIIAAVTLIFPFVAFVVGKLGDTLAELQKTVQLKRLTEEALTDALKTSQKYLDVAGVIILVLDRHARIVLLNKKGHSVLGYEEGELIGKDYITTCLPERIREEMSGAFARLMAGEPVVEHYENPIITKQGEERMISWHNTLLRDGHGNLINSLSSGEDITEIRKSEAALADSNAELNALLNALPDLMYVVDREGVLYDIRTTHPERLLYLKPASSIGKRLDEELPPETAKPLMDAIAEAARDGQYAMPAISITNKAETRWYEHSFSAMGNHREADCRFVVLAREITDRMRLSQQLIQSQKMEAVGRLAGGVAHDFNNILTVILGFCEIIRAKGGGDEILKYVGTIKDSANRAASLTTQLLAFSRKQILTPKIVDVDALVKEGRPMLARMLGEDIRVEHETSGDGNFVKVDPGQLQQVVMNLAVNARDAMPDGGTLTIKVQSVEVGRDDVGRPIEIPRGRYVLVQVRDTGSGMDKATMSHLFEPFFTTKELGKGTGLGLSIVYGVVKQSDGCVYAESELGTGSTFNVFLPRVLGEAQMEPVDPAFDCRGDAKILLVEDEVGVRTLIMQHLSGCGYTMLEANDGAEALSICRQNTGQIDLLLTDVVLPGIRGTKVAEGFRETNPNGRVIYMTGYTDSVTLAESARKESASILQKPFTLTDLGRCIRQALQGPSDGPERVA
jgi:PAS domain S-box-containing protein